MLAMTSYHRAKVWHDSATLWADVIGKMPAPTSDLIALNRRGTGLERAGTRDKTGMAVIGIAHAYNNFGGAYNGIGEYAQGPAAARHCAAAR